MTPHRRFVALPFLAFVAACSNGGALEPTTGDAATAVSSADGGAAGTGGNAAGVGPGPDAGVGGAGGLALDGGGEAAALTFAPDDSVKTGAAMTETFERFPSTCGVMNAPFKDDDDYTFGIYQFPIDGQGKFSVSFGTKRGMPVAQDLEIALDGLMVTSYSTDGSGAMTDVSYGQYGHLPISGGSLDFDWEQGAQGTQLLAGPALVHVFSFPTRDGDPFVVRIQLRFADGRVFDVTARAPLVSWWSGCASG